MTKYEGSGVSLSYQPNGGTAYTAIGQITELSPYTAERNPIDVTTRDDPNYYRTHIQGWKDMGETSFTIIYDPSLATHGTATGGLWELFNTEVTALGDWRLTFPDASTLTVPGFVTGLESEAPIDDALTASGTIKLSGEPTWA